MERLVVKSKAGSLYYNDTEQGVKLEPHEITSHQRRLLLERLHAYEDTGITPPEIMELAERNTPKESIYEIYGDQGDGADPDVWICPNCEAVYDIDDDYDFCPDCGQRIEQYEEE